MLTKGEKRMRTNWQSLQLLQGLSSIKCECFRVLSL